MCCLLKNPRRAPLKKKPRALKRKQLDELKHEIEMVVSLPYSFVLGILNSQHEKFLLIIDSSTCNECKLLVIVLELM